MTPQVAPTMPWEPDLVRLAVRGRVTVRVRPGTTYDDIATNRDVNLGAQVASARLDGGGLDQLLRRYSPAVRATRVYTSARGGLRPGYGHLGWDDDEQRLGMSHTFRLDLDPASPLLAVSDALQQLDVVESVSPCYLCQAPFGFAARRQDVVPGDHSVFDRVGAGRALAMEPGDTTVVIGIVDSGVALMHPELMAAVRPGADTVDLDDDLVSRGLKLVGDTRGRDRHPEDEMGHGTGCASIVGARGARVHPGLGGAARVLPLRALARAQKIDQQEPTAIGSIQDIDAAVKLGVDLGARVLNLSFGTPKSALRPGDPLPHADVVKYALSRGCVLVAASGNSGDAALYYPAALPGVIAVGSVNAQGHPSGFSCRGPHVALSAPGERVPCAGLQGYQENTGTSFAAPFVAAAAALLIARGNRNSTPLTASEIKEILMKSASPFPRHAEVEGFGSGVLDVPTALRLVDQATRDPPGLEGPSSGFSESRGSPGALRPL
ncbi:MAG: S8 family serine peptidase [Alphaproteobacteria bacterium]|nr:S8 family serine peptidase [Alphaproteobacteria bacterium]